MTLIYTKACVKRNDVHVNSRISCLVFFKIVMTKNISFHGINICYFIRILLSCRIIITFQCICYFLASKPGCIIGLCFMFEKCTQCTILIALYHCIAFLMYGQNNVCSCRFSEEFPAHKLKFSFLF